MDAGFATEDNLKLINSKEMKYVAVARNKIKNYEIAINTSLRMQTPMKIKRYHMTLKKQ
jgi:transposase